MSYEDLSNDLRSNDVISEGQHRPVAGEELPTEEQQNLIEPQELPFYLMRAPPRTDLLNLCLFERHKNRNHLLVLFCFFFNC